MRRVFDLQAHANALILLGQVIVDVTDGTIQFAAADAARTRRARDVRSEAVHLRRHAGGSRDKVHIFRDPGLHKAFNVDDVF